ncbi:MAG: hypothetical protein Kow0029_07430 [Candidatus Rifleibacteriota bacterium]
MKEKSAKEKIRKCEYLVATLTFLSIMGIIGEKIYSNVFHSAFLIGLMMGIAGFFSLSITFGYIDRMPDWTRIFAALSTSFKILVFIALAFFLKYLGFSITEVVIGLLYSQFIVIFSIVFIIYSTRETAENNITKESKK